MSSKQTPPSACGTLVDLKQRLVEGTLTSRQLVENCIARIEAQNGTINAFITLNPVKALEMADASDVRLREGRPLSPLDGIPIAYKANIARRGARLTCGSAMLADYVSTYDSTAMARLKEAGMPLLGSLNMDEFGMGATTETSAYGPTRNPWDVCRTPGGSSGGSAAAVAAGMAPVALGSDTGGSVRQPAAYCGLVGVRPAYGTLSRYGLAAFASSLDQIGILAQTARDAALVLDVLSGADPMDFTCDPALSVPFAEGCGSQKSLKGLTLAMPQECLEGELSPDIRRALEESVENWRALGAQVKNISLPDFPKALAAYYIISSAEASSNLARYDGVRYGHRATHYQDVETLYQKSRGEGLGPEVQRRILLGTFALSSDHWEAYYQQAKRVQEEIRRELAKALAHCDALLTPVTPTIAPLLGEEQPPGLRYLGDVYTAPASLAGLPSLSVPCGLNPEGLPMGMGLTGKRESLPLLLSMAHRYGEAYPASLGLRPLTTPLTQPEDAPSLKGGA